MQFITSNCNTESRRELNSSSHLTNEHSISICADSINLSDRYKSADLSDFIKNLNIGHFIPINSGHDGPFSQKEIEIYSLFLMNSRFIN